MMGRVSKAIMMAGQSGMRGRDEELKVERFEPLPLAALRGESWAIRVGMS